MEERKEHPALKLLEPKIKNESERLLKKNYFIMKLLNDIGCYLDKEFNTLKEFDMEAHFETLTELSNHFQILCEEKIEKRFPLHLIFILIVQIDDLDQHFENLINYIMQIFLSDNYCKIQKSILDKIMNDELKYCLKKERFSFVLNYKSIILHHDVKCKQSHGRETNRRIISAPTKILTGRRGRRPLQFFADAQWASLNSQFIKSSQQ